MPEEKWSNPAMHLRGKIGVFFYGLFMDEGLLASRSLARQLQFPSAYVDSIA
jgi:hypothetical protein